MNKAIISMGAKLFSNANVRKMVLPAAFTAAGVAATTLFTSCEKEQEITQPVNYEYPHSTDFEKMDSIKAKVEDIYHKIDSLYADTEKYQGTPEYSDKASENQSKISVLMSILNELLKKLKTYY